MIVRDKQLVPVGQFDDYIEFKAVLKFCDTGQWTLKIHADRPHTKLVQPDCGIVVCREGVKRPIPSGPVQGIRSIGLPTRAADQARCSSPARTTTTLRRPTSSSRIRSTQSTSRQEPATR
ncbi:hypothetical protein ACFY12_08930 [Streptomyces sp. NPDC001339]|uniref:Gp37-like protein n=1 Tax=Streptomyces sp. NPDC001339 TaxID=3364563 RepID=UPI0036B6CD76